MKNFNSQNSKEIIINNSTIENIDNEIGNQNSNNDNNNILFATQIY
jgi:hypothetical protein